MAADDLEVRLLRQVMDAQLPPEEPISRWIDWPDDDSLRIRAWDHALLLEGGLVEVHCLPGGLVEVKDNRDPRSMRFQRYDPARPGQPYMPPSREDCDLPAA
jgi:hypothetical protein